VYLTAAAISSLIQRLPSGTAYGIGVVLIVMMTGRLMQYKGSRARAVLPFVVHLQWGWPRVERAMERGKVQLDALFDERTRNEFRVKVARDDSFWGQGTIRVW